MKGKLNIGIENIGEIEFGIIDESMGCIGGKLFENKNYEKYKIEIQNCFKNNGVCNIENLNFEVTIENIILNPIGGIGVTHSKDFDNEIMVEVCGLGIEIIEKVKNNK